MTHSSPCADREMALHAMLDGELDAMAMAELERHLRQCAGCRALLDRLETTRAALRAPDVQHDVQHRAPAALSARMTAMAAPRRTMRTPWLGGAVMGALAASLVLAVLTPALAPPDLAQAVIDGHIRALQAGHLTDVAMSDRHVVKPWFNGRLPFAPPVPDLATAGFALQGGRLDAIEGQTVAVVVYRLRLHTINVFVRPAPTLPGFALARQDGFGIRRWRMDGLEFIAVSDVEDGDLDRFHAAFVQGAHSGRPER